MPKCPSETHPAWPPEPSGKVGLKERVGEFANLALRVVPAVKVCGAGATRMAARHAQIVPKGFRAKAERSLKVSRVIRGMVGSTEWLGHSFPRGGLPSLHAGA